ncbi:MAG: N-acetylglucosaminyldiphosphoundecaprenol N-acetyl-beta-D-mannosaminyltransferase [Acidimicrobiia bacterium]|nr:N-acetylglucosaminyldiphosphoundecaprenol N-acetyl-beta-D-mannosaminyltransferase [Acidimicrobiia bacterium]
MVSSMTGPAVLPTGRLMESKIDVLGVPVDAIDLTEAVCRIGGWIRARRSAYVCVTGVHGVMECQRDRDLQEVHARADLVVPDGMPLVWAGRYANARWMGRVYGPDLMSMIMDRSQEEGWRHYLYGGRPGVTQILSQELHSKFPRALLVGRHSPPFRTLTDAEDQQIIEDINRCSPDIVWVGISTPKQERWMAQHLERLRPAVLIGVGAAFDFHAGLVQQAPRWIQHSGLEWGFRLAHEPRRLWRRYLRNNPAFIRKILVQPPVLRVPFGAPSVTDVDGVIVIDLRPPSRIEAS